MTRAIFGDSLGIRLHGQRLKYVRYDETSHQRGVWDVPADYVKVAFNVSSLERPQRPPPCGRCSSPSRECSSPSRPNYEITASSKKEKEQHFIILH